MNGKVAVVTGAGTGIGRASATALLGAGWRVVFVTAADLHDPARLRATVRAALAG